MHFICRSNKIDSSVHVHNRFGTRMRNMIKIFSKKNTAACQNVTFPTLGTFNIRYLSN